MRAAFGAVDITPPLGVPMGGNVRADRTARGIHDPLLATVMILESVQTVVLISCDLLSVSTELSAPVKVSISQQLGISSDHVVVFATHTHSGPQVARDTPTAVTRPGAEWEEWIRAIPDRIAAGIAGIVVELQPADMEWNSIDIPGLAFNRRLHLRSGATCMNFDRPDPADVLEPWGPVDTELTSLRVVDPEGNSLGGLVHFTLHPAILVGEQWLLSRDFVGPLVRTVKESIGDVPILFANGAEGNINHLDFCRGRQGGAFAESERIGSRLGAAAISALNSAERISDPQLAVRAAPIRLRQRPITAEMLHSASAVMERARGVVPSLTDGVPPEAYAAWLLGRAGTYRNALDVRPVAIGLGPIAFAFAPGEPFVEFGIELRKRHQRHVRVVALADASIGYVPTAGAFDQGGYEVSFGTSTIAPGEGERLFNVIDDAVSGL